MAEGTAPSGDGSSATTDAEGSVSSGGEGAGEDAPAFFRLCEGGGGMVDIGVRPLALPRPGAGPTTAVAVRRAGAGAELELYGLSASTLAALEGQRTASTAAGDTARAARAAEAAAVLRFALPLAPPPGGAAVAMEGQQAAAAGGLFGAAGAAPGRRRSERRRLIDAEAAAAEEAVAARSDAAALRGCLLSVLPAPLRADARRLSPASLRRRIDEWREQRRRQLRADAAAAAAAAGNPPSPCGALSSPMPNCTRHRSPSPPLSPSPKVDPPVRPGSAPQPRQEQHGRARRMLAYAGIVYKPYVRPQSPPTRLDTSAQEQSVARLHDREIAQRRKKMARRRDICTRAHGPQWGCGVLGPGEVEQLGDRLYRQEQDKAKATKARLEAAYLPPRPQSATLSRDEVAQSNSRMYYQEQEKKKATRQRLLEQYIYSRRTPRKRLSPERQQAMADRLCPPMGGK